VTTRISKDKDAMTTMETETMMLGLALLVLLVQLVLLVKLVQLVPQALRDLRESKAQWDLLVHKDRRVKEVLQERSPQAGSTQ
jgi:hypothetical protein